MPCFAGKNSPEIPDVKKGIMFADLMLLLHIVHASILFNPLIL